MKKIITILALIIALSTTTCFATDDVMVVIEDLNHYAHTIEFGTSPVIEKGRVLVPVKEFFYELGYDVDWVPENKAIRAVKMTDDLTGMEGIILWINDCEARQQYYVWDSDLGDYRDAGTIISSMDVPPRIINGRTFVPLRFLSETFGYSVEADWSVKTVFLSPFMKDTTSDESTVISEPTDEYPPISDEQKAINNQYVQLFDEPVDTAPGAFQ